MIGCDVNNPRDRPRNMLVNVGVAICSIVVSEWLIVIRFVLIVLVFSFEMYLLLY